MAKAEVKIDDADVRAAAVKTARFQFAQYGMNNVPEEYLENYAAELLKDRNQVNGFVERSINEKLAKALKEVVTLEHKSVSVEDSKSFSKTKLLSNQFRCFPETYRHCGVGKGW